MGDSALGNLVGLAVGVAIVDRILRPRRPLYRRRARTKYKRR